jgi:hypothetical protein
MDTVRTAGVTAAARRGHGPTGHGQVGASAPIAALRGSGSGSGSGSGEDQGRGCFSVEPRTRIR